MDPNIALDMFTDSNYADIDTLDSNFINIFMYIATAIYFSFTIISLFNDRFNYKEDVDSYYNDIENYKLSYLDEFKNLEEIDHTKSFLNELANKFIHEETPMGDVIMTYNVEYHAFWYYADRKSIPYGILDAVARKFAIDYNCKSICINYSEEYDKAKIKYSKQLEEDEQDEQENSASNKQDNNIQEDNKNISNNKKSVFITFKSYNKSKKVQPDKKYIMIEKANRFTFKGFTRDWIDPKEIKKTKRDDKIKELNFSTFKRDVLTTYS